MFKIEMLPALNGDSLWIEYGKSTDPNRILIDGGTAGTYSTIKRKLKGVSMIDLIIITHVDLDHIAGILKIIKDSRITSKKIVVGDIWFNGWKHLPEKRDGVEAFGPKEGEILSRALIEHGLNWNSAFGGKRVALNEDGTLVSRTLKGSNRAHDMKLTVISPTVNKLSSLRPLWKTKCQEAGLDPTGTSVRPKPPPGVEAFGPLNIPVLLRVPFKPDKTETNGSSIAVLAEYEGKRVLLTGDAHPDVLTKSIENIIGDGERLRLDAFKLPHHGSKNNVNKNLLEIIDCKRFLFSTNGSTHKHPDRESVARVIAHGNDKPEPNQLFFNYKTEYTEIWDDTELKQEYNYETHYRRTLSL